MSVYEDIKTGLEQAIAYEKENNTKREKAILVIDMPESCDKCPLMFRHEEERCCIPEGRNSFCKKPSWCPLKPMPEKLEGNDSIYYQWGDYEDGWNHCLDEILGD